jgi:hypothetical protein
MGHRRTVARASATLLVLFIAACGAISEGTRYVNDSAPPRRAMSVAVSPFENLSTHPSAGLILSQLVLSQLYARGLFKPLEETEMRRRLKALEIELEGLGEEAVAAATAEALGVDAILLGGVTEYRYQFGLKEEPSVGVNMRLVRADGTILWAASDSAVGTGIFRRPSLNETAQSLVGDMIDGLVAASR